MTLPDHKTISELLMHFKRAAVTYSKAVGWGSCHDPIALFQEGCLDPKLCPIGEPPSREQMALSKEVMEGFHEGTLCRGESRILETEKHPEASNNWKAPPGQGLKEPMEGDFGELISTGAGKEGAWRSCGLC